MSTNRTITVAGQGRASITPDVVQLDLRVGHDAPDVAAALAGATQALTAVTDVVRSKGIEDRDIRTLGANVSQRWDNQTGSPSGFTGQQRLRITVRRLEAVGEILEAAASRVGNALLVDQVSLDVSDRAPAQAKARDDAFADARLKAQQYAAAAGSELGEVIGMAEAGASPVIAESSPKMAMMARDSGGMPVEAGELEIGAGVTVTWALIGSSS